MISQKTIYKMPENINPIMYVYNGDSGISPSKAYKTDVGFDLTALSVKKVKGDYIYETNAHLILPTGYGASLRPRSSIRNTDLFLRNSPGTIDYTYTGNIIVTMRLIRPMHSIFAFIASFFKKPKVYKVGDRIAQLVITPIEDIDLAMVNYSYFAELVRERSSTVESMRFDKGHGSTNI